MNANDIRVTPVFRGDILRTRTCWAGRFVGLHLHRAKSEHDGASSACVKGWGWGCLSFLFG